MTKNTNDKYDKITRKVKGLLEIAKDQNNDEESQSAFVMAQRLMIQYKLKHEDIYSGESEVELINESSVTIYKKLFWWEKSLAGIIAKNFRVKFFTKGAYPEGSKIMKNKIVFYGMESDLELAKEMFLLAYETLVYHSKDYIDNVYNSVDSEFERSKYVTSSIKSSYIQGFLEGLRKRFEEQVAELLKKNELMVLIPEEVEKSYDKYSQNFGISNFSSPNIKVLKAYEKGIKTGQSIDFTKRTISE